MCTVYQGTVTKSDHERENCFWILVQSYNDTGFFLQDCQSLHGDIPQKQREITLKGFRNGAFKVLVATNVAARGLDIPEVDLVVQSSPPKVGWVSHDNSIDNITIIVLFSDSKCCQVMVLTTEFMSIAFEGRMSWYTKVVYLRIFQCASVPRICKDAPYDAAF